MANDIKFTDHTPEVEAAIVRGIEKGLEMCGLKAEAYAKMICPVDTGRLRNSITHDTRMSERAEYIGTNVEYAPYVELGTSRTKAQPFLKPAATDHISEYAKMVGESIKGAINN